MILIDGILILFPDPILFPVETPKLGVSTFSDRGFIPVSNIITVSNIVTVETPKLGVSTNNNMTDRKNFFCY